MALSLYSLTWHVAIFLKFSTFLYFIFVKNKHTNSITFVINLFEKIAVNININTNVFKIIPRTTKYFILPRAFANTP